VYRRKFASELNGMLRRGLLVRHLVLPGHTSDSLKIFRFIRENLPEDTIISLMRQYVPQSACAEYPEINRKLRRREYERVEEYVLSLGFKNGYFQDKGADCDEFLPDFDLTGII
jgi:putative pyruvate formate lyase activating enzyme